MRLKSIKFSEFEGQPNEWGFDCTWGDINLVVGRNATGKTRMLNVISDLTELLAGQSKIIPRDINVNALFQDGEQSIEYSVKIQQWQIVHEKLMEGNKLLLEREIDNVGQIWVDSDEKLVRFQPPDDALAVVNRRDRIQHPFLEKLHDWATNARKFRFSTSMRQEKSSLVSSNLDWKTFSPENIPAIFEKGKQINGDKFVDEVKKDMEILNYYIEDTFTQIVSKISPGNIQEIALFIQEKDLPFPIIQIDISSGMFRALSLLIQINYLLSAHKPSCIIIDDIGEGLDFSRSTKLIKLLIEKVKGSQIQLIMSTNDQFVMDAVPLEYWQVIQREGNQLKIYNYHNSKAIFDKFEFTSLGNFYFFSSNYFLKAKPTS